MKTIVGLFDDFAEAKQAALDLESAGVAHDDISIVANNEGGRYVPTAAGATEEPTVTGHAIGHDAVVGAEIGGVAGLVLGLTGLAIPGLGWIAGAGWLMGTVLGAGTGAVIGGMVGALTHVGVPHEDAASYTEGVRRGGTLVAVRAQDEMAYRVAEILGDGGAVDIDERAATYRESGYSPDTTVAATAPAAAASATSLTEAPVAESRRVANSVDGTVIPVIEEQIAVGKRAVQSGGVRVYTHVTETPVQEQVTLREEHVTVDRHPVDRAASQSDISSALEDRSYEVTETSEVPVVSKQTRVVEEVTVGKTATERTENVQGTVRRTDVDVEELNEADDVSDRATNAPARY